MTVHMKIGIYLALLAFLGVVSCVYAVKQPNEQPIYQKTRYDLAKRSLKTKSSKGRMNLSRNVTQKMPTIEKKEPSGIETNIDDPADKMMHEDTELTQSGQPCKAGSESACRKRRQVRKYIFPPDYAKKSSNVRQSTDFLTKRNSENGQDDGVLDIPPISRHGVEDQQKHSNGVFRTDTNDKDFKYFSHRKRSAENDKRKHQSKERINHPLGHSVFTSLLRNTRSNMIKHRNVPDRNLYRNIRLERSVSDVAVEEIDNDLDSGYEAWGPWTSCSTTCGVGQAERWRRCRNPAKCHSGDIELRQCQQQKSCRTD